MCIYYSIRLLLDIINNFLAILFILLHSFTLSVIFRPYNGGNHSDCRPNNRVYYSHINRYSAKSKIVAFKS